MTATIQSTTVILAVVLVSMAFRMKGNYLAHGITMIVAVASTLVIAVLGGVHFSWTAVTRRYS